MFKRIVVPLDGSKTAEMVIPYVEEIAAKLGSRVTLMSVYESVPTKPEQLYQVYLEHITKEVQHQLRNWKANEGALVENKVLVGEPANEIVRYVDKGDVIDLIAMTSRGSSARGPWLLGNIAEKILRATTKPLLLVRAPASDAAIKQRRLIRRILLPLDGSELGGAAIAYAEVLGQALDAELVLFQVLERATGWASYSGSGATYTVPQKRKNLAIAYLDDIGKPLKGRGLKVSSAVAGGYAAEQIINYAESNSIDLIAMSTHGRTGIGRWVFGSVTDKLLHAGNKPLLVIRPK